MASEDPLTVAASNRARFAAISRALTTSAPSVAARRQGDVSTAHPAHYLAVAQPKRLPPPPPPEVPRPLATLRRLQKPNGRWDVSPELVRALGGRLPDPPRNISGSRWLAALVVTFIRRWPEYYDAMEPTVAAAEEFTSDRGVMAAAAEALPPPAEYYLDEAAVAARAWRSEAARMMSDVGYTAFAPPARGSVLRDPTVVAARYAAAATAAGGGGGGGGATSGGAVTPAATASRAAAASSNCGERRASIVSEIGDAPVPLTAEEEAAAARAKYREDVAALRAEVAALGARDRRSEDAERVTGLRAVQRRGLATEWVVAGVEREVPFVVGERVDVSPRLPHAVCCASVAFEPLA